MEVDSSPSRSIRAVKQALRNENWSKAKALGWRAITEGLPAGRLVSAFAAAGKPELLAKAMWNHRDQLFGDLATIASFARMVAGTELADEYLPKLERWAADGATLSVIRQNDYLLAQQDLDKRAIFALFHLKYNTWSVDPPEGPLKEAARHGDDFQVPSETAAFFYKHSRGNDRDFASWAREFNTAQMLHHLFSDGQFLKRFKRDENPYIRNKLSAFCQMAALEQHLDMEEAKRVYPNLDRSRGLLLCTFHGGFLKMSSFFFISSMPDPHWMTTSKGKNKQPNIISAGGNQYAAAFQTVKALGQGKAVLMAPDGPRHGTSSAASIEVLGLKTTISHGFAAMAYEADSDTGWISAVRQGDMFVPEFVPGPRRQEGERYSNFRDRWVSFYTDRIQSSLSSGPENIVPFARWHAPHNIWWG